MSLHDLQLHESKREVCVPLWFFFHFLISLFCQHAMALQGEISVTFDCSVFWPSVSTENLNPTVSAPEPWPLCEALNTSNLNYSNDSHRLSLLPFVLQTGMLYATQRILEMPGLLYLSAQKAYWVNDTCLNLRSSPFISNLLTHHQSPQKLLAQVKFDYVLIRIKFNCQ